MLEESQAPHSIINKGEWNALQVLKKDQSITNLPADKGGAVVIMNGTEYDRRMMKLLNDDQTYIKLGKDATNEYNNELVKT